MSHLPWIQSVPTYLFSHQVQDVVVGLRYTHLQQEDRSRVVKTTSGLGEYAGLDRIVLVTEQNKPLASLSCKDLCQGLADRSVSLTQPLSQLPCLRPLQLLVQPHQVSELWQSLQALRDQQGDDRAECCACHAEETNLKGEHLSQAEVALVNAEGQFIGLLNYGGLLSVLDLETDLTEAIQRSEVQSDDSSQTLLESIDPVDSPVDSPVASIEDPIDPTSRAQAQFLRLENAELVNLNQRKDELLACLSHELKTPMTAILGLSTLLERQSLGDLNDRQHYYTRLIHQNSRRLMDVVNDVLDLTRLETGQIHLTQVPIDLATLCQEAFSQALQRFTDAQDLLPQDSEGLPVPAATYHVDLAPLVSSQDLPIVQADPLRLRQMLTYLLTNALKFTPASGAIGVKVKPWSDRWIALTVWDSGSGIAAAKQPFLFQKFLQLGLSEQVTGKGAELGLMLTQRLAQMHGGDVSFLSQENQGSAFTLILPRAEISEGASAPILVMDLDPHWLEHIVQLCDQLDQPVLVARSLSEGLEKIQRFQPQTVLVRDISVVCQDLSESDCLDTGLLPPIPLAHFQGGCSQTWIEQLRSHLGFDPITIVVMKLAQEPELSQETSTALKTLLLPATVASLQAVLGGDGLRSAFGHCTETTASQSPPQLTLLCLRTCPPEQLASLNAPPALPTQLPKLLPQHRVLEANDLEQADLLARIWHPHTLLIDATCCANPKAYLEELRDYKALLHLPVITFDPRTTKAALQIPDLAVFPCGNLGQEETLSPKDLTEILLPVIQGAIEACNSNPAKV
jgi:signal transduction histidine kinase